nr:FAD:protein FMN transferase [Nevskia soli]
MGTRWSAQFHVPPTRHLAAVVDQLGAAVGAVDAEMSNWRTDSDISRLNHAEPGQWVSVSANLAAVLTRAIAIGRETHNAFNIGVGALVCAWGFGPAGGEQDPPAETTSRPCLPIDAVLEVDARNCRARRHVAVSLDLCGIAKGFGVDELARVLDRHGIGSWLVGIDGEMRARGRKPDGAAWAIAIEAPSFECREAMSVIELGDGAIATSGDYRHWRDVNGERISHTMDPRSGTPLLNGIASATVVAPTCTDADAYATALMVLGLTDGLALARQQGLNVLLVGREGGSIRSSGTGCFDKMPGE